VEFRSIEKRVRRKKIGTKTVFQASIIEAKQENGTRGRHFDGCATPKRQRQRPRSKPNVGLPGGGVFEQGTHRGSGGGLTKKRAKVFKCKRLETKKEE